MSNLQLSATTSGLEIVSRDGRLLCSPRNPAKEASDWLERNKDLIAGASHIGVVGSGSGFHIQALEANYPMKKIIVFELDQDYLKLEKKYHSPLVIGSNPLQIRKDEFEFFSHWPVLIPFRPAFQPMDKSYVEFWMGLAQRTETAVNKLVSGKGYESIQEEKIWMCLRELVK